ncbi:MAG: LacI family transcriptional regulator [Candidatus Omnitrophica bacterium]|nr:LacI family transcriptional regulator [Candidatus Omnitrophota bacterium]
MAKKKISIEDVAQRAKVSITTVSRVINNVATVSDKNRIKVEEAIAALKFKPNISAQRLARGVNNAIGLVMPGYPGIFHSYYAIELIRGVGHACETHRMDMVFHITDGHNPINSNNVDGIIFADIIENRKQVEAAISVGTPVLIINNQVHDMDVNYVAIDNREGGKMVAEYLTGFGHHRIATITGKLNTQAGHQRLEGFKTYLEQSNGGLPDEYVIEGDYSRRSARLAAEEFLQLDQPPTAIFAASDDMALEAIAVLLERGLRVPEDISVIGFDDNPACLFGPVALTTVRQPLFQMAEQAVKVLVENITKKNEHNVHQTLVPEMVVRETCCPPQK